MNILIEALIIALANMLVDFVFVLLLNPRRATKRIKSEIASDSEFRHTFVRNLLSEDMLSLYDPILDKLNQKIRGSLIQPLGQVGIEEKMIGKALVEDMKEKSPEYEIVLDVLKDNSPTLYKLALKRPDLIPKIIEKARGMGIPIPSIEDGQDNIGENPYDY